MARAARAAVAQLCSSNDKLANFDVCAELVRQAKTAGAEFVCFPEAFEFMGRPGTDESRRAAEPLDGPTLSKYRELAKQHSVWLSLGGFHERLPDTDKIANTHVVVDALGGIQTYRKMHLFDVDYDGGFMESNSTERGREVLLVRDTPIGNVGVTTCYDIRFPEMYSLLRDMGADVLLAPSAFMPTTGAAHWHVLLRARAIETQCYVIAAAQAGTHNAAAAAPGERLRASYGHSLAVDPFGRVLADLGETEPALAIIDLDFSAIAEVRHKMPVQQHRQETAPLLRAARDSAAGP